MEAGTNDIVVLPILLVLIAIAHADLGGPAEWLRLPRAVAARPGGRLRRRGRVLGHGPGRPALPHPPRVPVAVRHRPGPGRLRHRRGGRRDGFLAAFAAGLAVTAFNQTLCDCFLDFGQVIAETTMLLAFVLFGAVLSTLIAEVPPLATLALAALAIFIIRPLVVRSRCGWAEPA